MIHLKQDALHLFNLAIAGCVCGALIDLFQAAYGYPESAECQLLDKDDEVRIIEPEQDLKEQEKLFPHPFQKNSPASAKPPTSLSLEPKGKAPTPKPESWGKKTLKWIIPAPAPSGNRKQEIAKKSHISQMTYPDCMKLANATPLYPTTAVKLCWSYT